MPPEPEDVATVLDEEPTERAVFDPEAGRQSRHERMWDMLRAESEAGVGQLQRHLSMHIREKRWAQSEATGVQLAAALGLLRAMDALEAISSGERTDYDGRDF